MNNDFTIQLARALVESEENFPVDFDELWQWCGYSQKGHAKTMLLKNFDVDLDFRVSHLRKTKSDGSFSHIEHKLSLTIDAAKMFAMLAQTDQGKIVRQYFLQVEKEYKQLIRQQQSPIVFNSCWEQRGVPFLRNTQIPAGYWGIYSELFFIFKNLEDSGFPLPERAVLDISVGQHWNWHLKESGIDPTEFPKHPHQYPDSRGRQPVRIYPNDLLGMFRDWLGDVYMKKPVKRSLIQ